jgi:allophanate hydrolase subunit 1
MAKDSEVEVDLTPLTSALSKLAEDLARKMVQEALPGLVEKAIAEEKVLIKETVQEMTRQLAQEIIEKIAREIVPDQAETAVKKEIERLTAEV